MASVNREEATDLYYLQPQLLTKEGLIELLELRCIKLRNIHAMSKDQLVEVFQRVGVPLPQRKYKLNRRGKLLTRLRTKQESVKSKSVPDDKNSNISIGFGGDSSTSQFQSHVSSGNRLKPPPDAIRFERKTIRLNNSSSKSEELDKIKIKRSRTEDIKNGNCVEDKSHKHSTHNGEQLNKDKHNSCTSDSKDTHTRTKIVLKRSHSSTTEIHNSTDAEPDSKKEKKKITWP